ncbi:hypothetical protein AV955_gp047 [Diadromus pulchellus ascovirus 4a]|uniref:Complete DpAV4 genome n=1 Tax=Diadromus pulchellus ascovirus 4a TaxID=158683 RepID=F2NYX6_9VIRU|nr:hypothetical protein AV955_gp047 [Diadromus pulchellus ascovirus 4a]CCA61404.1 unnamed protein product [Diadromus pulchellus ascovirus 4a]
MRQLISMLRDDGTGQQRDESAASHEDLKANFSKALEVVLSDPKTGNQDVKILGTFESPWLRGLDLCKSLGHPENDEHIKKLVDEKHIKSLCQLLGVADNMCDLVIGGKDIYVDEAGMYRMITASTHDRAKPMHDFVHQAILHHVRVKP